MRIGDGLVLVQERPEESDNSDWLDIAVLRTTENAYTHIYLENGAHALASKYGLILNEQETYGNITFQISAGNKESYLKFFRDVAKGVSIDGKAVSSLGPEPSFHESLFGQVFKGGEPHPETATIAAKLTQPRMAATLPSSTVSAPASSSLSSSGVETLDEILTVLRTANVRAQPSAQADKIGRLKAGTEVDVTGRTMVEGKQWYRLDLDGREAYVIGYLLSPSSAPPAAAPSVYAATSPTANATAAPTDSTPSAFQPGSTFKDRDDCPEMVVIPAGRFRMGDLNGAGEKYEVPVHQVTIPRSFAVGKYEVTRDQYAAFSRATNRKIIDGCGRTIYNSSEQDAVVNWQNPGFDQTGRDPVTCVTWEDAKAYVAWMSDITGQSYRLLSESEWEYAARAGTDTLYSFGNLKRDMCIYGNGADLSLADKDDNNKECNDGFEIKTAPVGSFRANGFGLHDMHGNVDEWLEDCHPVDFFHYDGAPDDGSAWTNIGTCRTRLIRSGSWWSSPKELRSASRSAMHSEIGSHDVGFRVARSLTNSN